ncbi:MAG: integrase [Gammaproteobacteria bacterium GWE2_42_36]|nr:MAG: integrase [Gammaproteobacteria bacterium GWE2_42_36]HCU05725.1 integrase [Coxiellaceae bacterium]
MIAIPEPLFDSLDEVQSLIENKRGIIIPPRIPSNAKEDYEQGLRFIYSYLGSEATFNAYRREVERLLQWVWFIAKKTLKEIHREDIENYIYFCQFPPESWIGTKNVPRFILKEGLRMPHAEWRPFVASISKSAFRHGEIPTQKKFNFSQKAIQAVFAILGSFFNFLVQENYLGQNPVIQIRQKSKFIRKQQSKAIVRRLSELQWAYVIETAKKMATENPEEDERTLFMMSALFGMYLRISELAASERWIPQMGDFYLDQDSNWWFTTVGKGNKQRDISVSDSMLDALKRYRLALGLAPLPARGDTTPLIAKATGKGPISSTRHIRSIVQKCFDRAIEQLRADGFQDDAEALMSATVHWLRHTGISEDVKHRPREHVRDDAGHSSSAITDRYIDIERQARHISAKNKRIDPDEPSER